MLCRKRNYSTDDQSKLISTKEWLSLSLPDQKQASEKRKSKFQRLVVQIGVKEQCLITEARSNIFRNAMQSVGLQPTS